MASSHIRAASKPRQRYLHVSAPIIPKGTVIGHDKKLDLPIHATENMVGRGITYRKPKQE